ncbi:MAG: hypothetical protein U9P11_05545, partial [Pseudomonadota bacterium]|nr:hypothetical protein [Pseudomonadota bacterium]
FGHVPCASISPPFAGFGASIGKCCRISILVQGRWLLLRLVDYNGPCFEGTRLYGNHRKK